MDLDKLRHLVALADHPTAALGAKAVNLSPAAFGRSLRALESDMGMPLVVRDGRRLVLTSYGVALAERARRILFEAGEARRALELLRDGETGRIAVGFGPNARVIILPPLLTEMAARPLVKLDTQLDTIPRLLAMLREDRIDLLLGDGYELGQWPDLDVEPLPSARGCLFCRPDHPVLAESGYPGSLVRYQVAGPDFSHALMSMAAMALGPAIHLRQLLTWRCDDQVALLGLATRSDVIVAAGEAAAAPWLADGRLVVLPTVGGPWPTSVTAAARRKGRVMTPLMEVVYATARAAMQAAVDRLAALPASARAPATIPS